jgi:hypothetical protein
MKRTSQFALLLLFVSMPIFSASFTFSSELSNGLDASDNKLGKIVGINKSELLLKLDKSLSEEFSPSWIEAYVSEDNLYGFSKSYSSQLANILPLNVPYYFLTPVVSKSETQLIIRCIDERIITFIFDINNYLVAMTIK